VIRGARRPRSRAVPAPLGRGASVHRLTTAAAGLCVLLCSERASAELKLTTQAPAKVEVGQRFSVQLTALAESDDETPSQPKLPVPPNCALQGPSISTQRQVNMTLGRIENRTGISATWILSCNSLGRFKMGPGSVISGGRQVADKAFIVEIVPAGSLQGQRQRSRGRFPMDPFDPFGDFDPFSGPLLPPMRQFGGPLGQTLPGQQDIAGWPHELDIAAARDPLAFLDARVTPKKVVIGQQLSYSVFAYGHAGPFGLGNPSQPPLKDFLNYDLMDGENERLHPMRIGSELWYATKIQERALFPLRAGKLVIEPMRVQFRGAGMGGDQYGNAQRESQPLSVLVVEPPLDGRPPGYRLGDVGQFALSATVEPREVNAQDAVAINLTLSGLGNLPQKLDLPEIKGVEWLEPTTSESVERKGGRIGGKRSWLYVVKLNEPGSIDLGRVRLPYWDPERSHYQIASVQLGQVRVKPNAVQPTEPAPSGSAAASAVAPLALVPRDTLGEVPPPPRYWADFRYLWLLVLAGPLGVIAGMGLKSLGAAIGGRLARQRASVKRRTQEQLAACRQILASGDAPAAASALERALVIAIESATAIRARGIVRDELASHLTKAGISQTDAEAAVAILDVCDAIRFTGGEPQQLATAIDRAQPLIDGLCRRSAATKGPGK